MKILTSIWLPDHETLSSEQSARYMARSQSEIRLNMSRKVSMPISLFVAATIRTRDKKNGLTQS